MAGGSTAGKLLGGHLGRERARLSARSVDAAQAVLDQTVRCTRERKPVGTFHAVPHKLAQMAVDLQLARVMTNDSPRRDSAVEDIIATSATVKAFTTGMYNWAADLGLQVLGGTGYLRGAALQRHFRESWLLRIGSRTTEITINLIAQALGV